MSRSEFRWNKKRKHYAYLFKDKSQVVLNILITTKPFIMRKGKISIRNVPLFRHPNPNYKGQYYIVPRKYADYFESFEIKVYKNWSFDKNDKRKVKRIKKNKKVGSQPYFSKSPTYSPVSW